MHLKCPLCLQSLPCCYQCCQLLLLLPLLSSPPCPHSLQNLTTIGSTSSSLSLSSSSSAAALCLWHPKLPLLCCWHAESSFHIRKNLLCVEMIVGVNWHKAAATFWYQNPIFGSKTDANKCIQKNKTGIQSLWENRSKQMDTKYVKGNPISASKNRCKHKIGIQPLQANRRNPNCANNVSFSNVVPGSTKPNCKGRLSWGRNT